MKFLQLFLTVGFVSSAPILSPTTPIATPERAPVTNNVTAPAASPVKAPTAAPRTVPVAAPVKAPTAAPKTVPVQVPVKLNVTAPVKAPVLPPTNFTAPVTTPVRAPAAANITVPTPVKAPVLPPTNATAPLATPVRAPVVSNITVPTPVAAPISVPINGTGPFAIRINAGSKTSWQDPTGNVWEADKYFGTKGGMFSLCPMNISGTELDEIYCSERFYNMWQTPKPFQYDIPITRAAAYSVKLHFAEIYYKSAGSRIFDVLVNGKMVKQSLDIAKEVGYAAPLVVSTVVKLTTAGSIAIELQAKAENPKISAIEIVELTNYVAPPTMAPVAAPFNMLINVGGTGFTDTLGRSWKADQYFTGGNTYTDGSNPITGTIEDSLYQTERYGEFKYNVPVPNGGYEVILHFAELYWQAPKQRLFNIDLEDTVKYSNVDLVALGNGQRLQAVTLKKVVKVTDGLVSIAFSNAIPQRDHPKLSGIEINPMDLSTYVPPPTKAPVAAPLEILINVGGNGFISADGEKEWVADKYFTGGNAYVDGSNSINGTLDDTLYQTERYGEFQYNIPVPNGSYRVVLHFAELYWQGVGQRLFNVQVQNSTSYKNMDLVKLGNGKRLQALTKTSIVNATDGFVTIEFTNSIPRVDNPKLSGIAITPSLK